jgi:hypothetical protein
MGNECLNEFQRSRIVLTGNLNLFVDGANGNDANDGSQARPFKTIQRAINNVPPVLASFAVSINVTPGTYPESIVVGGKVGGVLYLRSAGTVAISDLVVHNGAFLVVDSATSVSIQGDGTGAGVLVRVGGSLRFAGTGQLIVTGKAYAVLVQDSGVADINNVTANNCTNAIYSANCNISVATLAGTGVSRAFVAAGGKITYVSAPISASTLHTATSGGRIYMGGQTNTPNY